MAAPPEQAPNLQQLYPPPPPFFRLYAEGAQLQPPAPPPPIDGTYQMFGELHTVRRAPALCS